MTENVSQLYRIATLIDDLKHEDQAMRINSIKSLNQIAEALGPERTRTELVPFLDDTSIDDEDEVLQVLAEELCILTDFIGGQKHIPVLLRPLEQLATVEEATVSERAIKSLYVVAAKMTNQHVSEHFVPLLRRLAEKDWYTARSAACSLFAAVYQRVPEETKAEIRGLYGRLSKDDLAMVRKAAAANLGKFAEVVEGDLAKTELLPLHKKLCLDEQDAVRLHSVSNVISFAKLMPPKSEIRSEVLLSVFDIAKDKAWRVRWTLANSYLDIVKLLDYDKDIDEEVTRFVKQYVRLLEDVESEVKAAAALGVVKVSETVMTKSGDKARSLVSESFLPPLAQLCSDTVEFVRSATASVLFGMAPVIGKKRTEEVLVSLCYDLLKDKDPEVRLKLIGQLDDLKGTIQVETLSHTLLPAVSELAKDNLWRIRHSVIENIPLLARHLSVKTFDKNLLELCNSWLLDEVFSIRQKATENLKPLTKIYGEAWVKDKVLPKIVQMSKHTSYLFRMQAIRCVESLCMVLGEISKTKKEPNNTVKTDLIPIVLLLARDKVANIRFNVAKCLETVYDVLDDDTLNNKVKPVLETLEKDTDHDVKFFVTKSLEKFK